MASEHDSSDYRSRTVSVEVFDSGPPSTSPGVVVGTKSDKDRKIGHRRVDPTGQVTYKKRPTSELMGAIQLGISQSIGSLAPKPMRDVLYQDFHMVKTVFFPREGSNLTPGHKGSDFKFKTYAPVAFRYFRELFKIRPEDFLLSLCNEPLRELSNPGASGSIFYITVDDEFIIKTVEHQEADFLQKLLPGYYMNLNQNPCTLLPKFYGLYCYECGGKNIRFVVMNNLLPSSIHLHEKYDLKGSTYKRKASKLEKLKAAPTLKDLDFRDVHPDGIALEPDTYAALIRTIDRDCRVLESFKIMDYSLLVGIQNLSRPDSQGGDDDDDDSEVLVDSPTVVVPIRPAHRPRLAQYSTTMEAIQGYADVPLYSSSVIPGGIPANNSKGEQLLLYIGIIDILQSYHFAKKFEHVLKSLIQDGDTISVHHPTFYAQRFRNFFAQTVFRNKQPQSRRKSFPSHRSSGVPESVQIFFSSANGRGTIATRRPGVLPQSTWKPEVLTSSSATAFAEVHQFETGEPSTFSTEANSRADAVSILPSSTRNWNWSDVYLMSLPRLDRPSSACSTTVSTQTEAPSADTTPSCAASSVSTNNPAPNEDSDSHARYSVTIEQLSAHLASNDEVTCL